MAGLFERLKLIFNAKADKALDKLEDPRETLDYSYQRQLELLQKVRRGVADVATSRKRVELQANQLDAEMKKLSLSGLRVRTRTDQPASSRAGTSRCPTKPVTPVTRAVRGFMSGSDAENGREEEQHA